MFRSEVEAMSQLSKMADEESMEKGFGKRKKGSMKNKKSWRKKTDIIDVEEHLDDLRQQERTGGIIAEKPNESLFFIEKKTGSTEDDSAISSISKDSGKSKETIESSDEEEYIPKKLRLQKKREREKENDKLQLAQMKKADNDVWNQQTVEKGNSWIEPALVTSKKKPKTVGERPSSLKSVEVCHPGASYNPEFDEHQKLLQEALQKETAFVNEQEKLREKLKFLSDEEFKQKPSWFDEMSEGLSSNDVIKEVNVEVPDGEEETVLSKTVNSEDRKARKTRRKEKERVQEERIKEEERLKKVRLNDVYRLRTLKKELKAEEMEKAEKRERKIELKLRKSLRPQRLGRLKYIDSKLDFQLSEELAGSFRGLKPEGDPFLERMKSFEKRSLIEPRKKVIPRRKYKEKFVEKRSYKQPTVKEFTTKTS